MTNNLNAITEDQASVLEQRGIDVDTLVQAEAKDGSGFAVGRFYTDGNYIVFFDVRETARNRTLYFLGFEDCAELTALWDGVALYEGAPAERLERFLDKPY